MQWVLVAALAILLVAVLHPLQGHAATGINQQISFEGKVVSASGVNIPDGNYNMEFKIYTGGTGCVSGGTSPCGGTLAWTEDHLVNTSTSVTVTAGTFQVNLGSVAAFGTNINWNTDTLWLSMNIGGTNNTASPTYDGEMTPFIRLTSVPYALNAGMVGGLSAAQLVQLTPAAGVQTGTVNVTGNITSTTGTLQAATIDAPASGSLTVGSTANTTSVILNQNTTVTSGKTLSIGGQTVFSGTGILQAAAISSSIAYSNITQIGTITAGTWNASTIGAQYGGTGQSTYTVGDLLYASASTTLGKLSDVATGSCLISGGTATAPTWGSCGSGANTALSNLTSTAVNVSIIPGATYANAIDLGSSSYSFRTGYFGTSLLAPTIDALTAGGTINIGTTSATALNIGVNGSTATAGVANISTSSGAAQDINIGGTGTSGGSNSGTTVAAQAGATDLFIQNSGAGIQTYTNSTTAFQVQNSAGAAVLLVDTTSTAADGTTVNYLKYPGFETGSFSNAAAGWAASNPATLTQNTSKASTYNGLYSAQVVTTASNGGLTTSSFTSAPPSGSYLVSFFAKVSTGTMASTAFSVATAGGTGSCVGAAGVTINSTGFQRVYCQLTASGVVTSLTITQNDSTARTIYIDAVQLQSVTFNGTTITQPTPYQIGAIQLRGVITNPVALINNGNSTAAFQIQNAGGNSNLFVADTLNTRIGIGTNSPTALLSVGASSQLQVDGSGNIVASGSYNGNAFTASTLSFSASSTATIQSASGQNLALNTGTAAGTISTNAGSIQRITSGGSTFTFDLEDTGTTNFKLFNSGSGVANLWLYGGGLYTGTGQTIRLDNSGNLSNIGTISSTGNATFNGNVQIGSATADATQANLQLDSSNNFADTGTCTTTAYQGAMYYNTATGTMRACINGNWEDMVSTGGLGLLAYGVVPDSANSGNIGELAGINQTTSPCKVYWASATSVSVAPCYAYSGGRKVVVPLTTLPIGTAAANTFINVCLTGTNGAPALVGTSNAADTATSEPTWTSNNPILCLATLNIVTANNISGGKIYDIRTFTTTQKTFATSSVALGLGTVVVQNTTTANLVSLPGATAAGNIRGVVVAYSGATSTTAANVILATAGPQWVKATAGTLNGDVQALTTGYTQTITLATTALNYYSLIGAATRTLDTSCTSNATCQYSQFLNPLSIK